MLRINSHRFVAFMSLSFFSFTVFADVCPDVSTIKDVGHHIFGKDSANRKLFADNFNHKIPFVSPYKITFVGAQIRRARYATMTGNLQCDYIYTSGNQTFPISLVDYNSVDANVQPVGKNWVESDKNRNITACNDRTISNKNAEIALADCAYFANKK